MHLQTLREKNPGDMPGNGNEVLPDQFVHQL